ncbi:MAG: hypothetical protein HY787_16275 [Deltaproteobacteria bacterium]|nr:hypothetical protein [Deltaproteobacteria bacterium]
MRQFLVDEIPRRQMEEIEVYLKEKTVSSGMKEIFWLEIPERLLSPVQEEHKACGPHYLAIETGQDFIKFEFLVRCRNRLRCDCVQYATPPQETYLMDFAHTLIQGLDLKA